MGIFKAFMFLSGVPVRPTTKKGRLYRHQMGMSNPLEGIGKNLFGSNQQDQIPAQVFIGNNEFSEGRVACSTCAEMIMPAASKCRFCGELTNLPNQNPKRAQPSLAPDLAVNEESTVESGSGFQFPKFGVVDSKIDAIKKISNNQPETMNCPSCHGVIVKGASKCRYCKNSIGGK